MIGRKRGFERRLSPLALLLALGLAAPGCAAKANHAVEAARREVLQASSDPAVTEHAGGELLDARSAVDEAEARAQRGEDAESQHLARVAETRVEMAREVARAGLAQSEIARLEKELAELKAHQTEQGLVLTLSDVLFEVDSDRLKPEAKLDLARLAAFLNANPDRAIVIEGHADSTGATSYNFGLSRRRAEAVETFLVAAGVDPLRMHVEAFGEEYPVASNATATGRAMNRRVEMLVLNPGAVVSRSSVPIIRYETTRTTFTQRD